MPGVELIMKVRSILFPVAAFALGIKNEQPIADRCSPIGVAANRLACARFEGSIDAFDGEAIHVDHAGQRARPIGNAAATANHPHLDKAAGS